MVTITPTRFEVSSVNNHAMAVVHPAARVAADVEIGPFCVVEEDVTIGEGCVLESHVVVKSGTTLGPGNRVGEGTVLGGYPQHIHRPENPGRVIIGANNTFRENVTVHRALEAEELTSLGDNNLLMVNAHVAHDCKVGNNTIITNNAMLGGHVLVEDRAYISGAVAVHQFCRVGTMAMVGGQAHVTRDVPPFVTIDGLSSLVVGLNQIGLRRAGLNTTQIRELKEAYRVVYRSGLPWAEILEQLQLRFPEGPAVRFHQFLADTKRGIIPERRMPPRATLKIRREEETKTMVHAKAG